MNLSLIEMLRNNTGDDFSVRLKQQTEEVKKSKASLVNFAESYQEKHKEEIEEGDRKAQLLLSEGLAQGLSKEEIFERSGFIPTRWTPILNSLYFILREQDETEKIKSLINEYIHTYGYDEKIKSLLNDKDIDKVEEFGDTVHEENIKEPIGFEEVLYGGLTHDIFRKLKKLKTLSYSNNSSEAAAAHLKFIELTKFYKLDPDKIPVNN